MLQQENEKGKAWHNKHHIPHSFQIRDQVWLHLKKECFTSSYRKLKPLRYGLYNILQQIGENNFQLDIPLCLGLHSIFIVDLLQPYHAPLLEQNELEPIEPEDIHPNFQEPLPCDTIAGRCIRHTRMNATPFFGKYYLFLKHYITLVPWSYT